MRSSVFPAEASFPGGIEGGNWMDDETALPHNTPGFFQDTETFQLLRTQIVPTLIAHADACGKTLRFWSAGCATGEDAYSLAMLLTDLLGEALPFWTIRIFATDLQGSPLDVAKQGIYSESHQRFLTEDQCIRWFEPGEHGSRVGKPLRDLILFGHHNLTQALPFARLDLILCRQILTTCPFERQSDLIRLLAFSLAPKQGYLVLGQGENLPLSSGGFQPIAETAPIYQSTFDASTLLRMGTQGVPTFLLHHLLQSTLPHEKLAPPPLSLEAVLCRLAPGGIIVIDQNYRILTTNRAAHHLCSLPENVHLQDFLHSVPGIPYTLVRAAIETTFLEGNAHTLSEIELSLAEGGNGRVLALHFCLLPTEVATPHHLAIYLHPVTELVVTRQAHHRLREAFGHLQASYTTLTQQHTLLLQAHQHLQETSTLLLSTYEQVQCAYEESQAINETLEQEQEELRVELESACDALRLQNPQHLP
jgi:two-component system CheB/CheR fusion protein